MNLRRALGDLAVSSYILLVLALIFLMLTGCCSKPARIANRTCNFDPPRRPYVAPARPMECSGGECQIPSDVGQKAPPTPYLEPECADGQCDVPPSIPLTGQPAQKSEDNEAILEPIGAEGPVGPALEMDPTMSPRDGGGDEEAMELEAVSVDSVWSLFEVGLGALLGISCVLFGAATNWLLGRPKP